MRAFKNVFSFRSFEMINRLITYCILAPCLVLFSIQGFAQTCPTTNAGSNDNTCGNSYKLNAVLSFGTGTWTVIGPGTATFSPDNHTPNATVTVSAYGSYDFTWTEVLDTCSDSKTVNIVFNQKPIAFASNNGPMCVASSLSLIGGPSGMTTYSWKGPNSFTSALMSPVVSGSASAAMAGTYTLTITDSNNCQDSASTSVTINPLPTASISGNTAVCLNAAQPNVVFTGANGTAPYTFIYKINNGSNLNVTTTSGNTVLVAVPTSTADTLVYSLISVSDGSSTTCSQSQLGSAIVIVNPLPTATVSGTTAVCKNATPPKITFTGAGGTAPYTFTYQVNGGSNQVVSTSSGNSATVEVPTTTVGTFVYSLVSVQDASSSLCSQAQSGSATVTVNPLPTATIDGTTAVCLNTAQPNVTFTGTNGTAPYTFTYTINSGPNQEVTTSSGNSENVAVPTSNAGTFTYTLVSVKDASSSSCSQIQAGSATITVNPLPMATISGSTTVCMNASSPLITFIGLGGTAPYTFTYKINGGSDQIISTTSGNSVTLAAPTTSSGTFTYTLISVRDASPTTCSQAQSGSATITVNPLPTGTISGTTSICYNASQPSITFTGANSTAPYTFTYSVNGGPNQTITTSSGNSTTVSVPTSTAGTFVYSLLSVKDGSSTTCAQTQSGAATVIVNPLPTATISGTTATCKDAPAPGIVFMGDNGTAPYTFTYSVNSGGDQTLITTSGNTVSLPVSTSTTGVYTYALVSVKDASSTTCSQSQSGTATVTVNPLPTASIIGTTSVCLNAASPLVTFTGANSTAPYNFTYKVNDGPSQSVSTTSGNSVNVPVPTTTSGTLTYSLINVQDASTTACSQAQSGTASITVNPIPTASISGTTTVCLNSASPLVTFSGSNGTAPYTFVYKINDGANQTLSTTSGSSVTLPVPTSTAGTFTYSLVSVQDASSTACSQLQPGSVIITVNPLPTGTLTGSTSVCLNASQPTLTFTGANATAPYTFTYQINGGTSQTVTTSADNSVTVSVPTNNSGTFDYMLLSIKDGSSIGCVQTQSTSATVLVNPLPTATISGTSATCMDGTSQGITFTGANGTAPYTFTYTVNSGTNQTLSTTSGNSVVLPVSTGSTGAFTFALVGVRDASSTACSQSQSGTATLTVNPLPTALISGTTEVCLNSTQPNVTFTGGNGTAPYTFTYTINGGASKTITTSSGNSVNLAVPTNSAGTFVYSLVSVQDASSTLCSQTQSGTAVITVNSLPTASIMGTTEVCLNASSPNVTFIGANGTAPYTFSYQINGGTIQKVSTTIGNSVTVAAPTSTAGTFIYSLISVTDGSLTSCSQPQSGSATITVNALPNTSEISGNLTPDCGGAGVIYSVTSTAGSSYSWSVPLGSTITSGSTGPNNNSITVTFGSNNGNVSVIETNSLGCTGPTKSLTISLQGCLLHADFQANKTTICNGTSVTFTNLSTGTSGSTTYSWNFGSDANPATAMGMGPYVVTYSSAGQKTVSLTITDGASNTATKANYISVTPLPTASISGTTSTCLNAVLPNIEFAGTLGTAPYTFTYTINNGPAQTVTTTTGNSVKVPASTTIAGSYIYTLTSITDALSCSQSQSGNAIVTINPLPSAVISGTTAVCKDDSPPNISFTGLGGTAPYTFVYKVNGGSNQTITTTTGNTVTTANPTGTPGEFIYSLVSIQESSSATCSQAQTGTATIKVNPLPTANISGTASVCMNAIPPLITFTGANGTSPYTFTYSVNSGSNQTISTVVGNSVNLNVPTNVSGVYTYGLLKVTDGSTTACSQVQGGTSTIVVNPLPTATISGTTAVCQNSSMPFITFTGSGGTSPYKFTYSINGGASKTISTSTGNVVKVAVPTTIPGIYTYALQNVQDASTTECNQNISGSAIVTVNALPTASISGTKSVCLNEDSTYIVCTGYGGVRPYKFEYSVNGQPSKIVTSSIADTAMIPVSTSSADTLIYTLLTVQDGSSTSCKQSQTGSAIITVNGLPTGSIKGTTEVCQYSAQPPIIFKGQGGVSPYIFTYSVNQGPAQTIFSAIGDSAIFNAPTDQANLFTYKLISIQESSSTHCLNLQKDSVRIQVDMPPNSDAGSGGINCGLSYMLHAIPSRGVGTWTISSGPGTARFDPSINDPKSTVTVSQTGVYEFSWTEVNGMCNDISTVQVTFIDKPAADAGMGGTVCDTLFSLNASPTSGIGTWTQFDGPGLSRFYPDSTQPDANVHVTMYGKYTYYWTVIDSSCTSSDFVNISFYPLPLITASQDTTICEGESAPIYANGTGQFFWSPDSLVDSPHSSHSLSRNTKTTVFKIRLIDDNGCSNVDSVKVTVYNKPVADAGPDQLLNYIFETTLDAKLDTGETGRWSVLQGSAVFSNLTDPFTSVKNLELHDNLLLWTVTNEVCPASVDTVLIRINDLVIPSLITPNGDPYNEYFVIRGLETLGKTELIILNRDGIQVFRNMDYKNDWNGVDINNIPLPDDTYYYIIKPTNGSLKSGFIVIKR